jgi:glycosyltransferase involved in cell wall biosynthesis
MKILIYFNSMAAAGGIERVISSHISFFEKQENNITLLTKDKKSSFYPISRKVNFDSINIEFEMNMNSKWKRICSIIIYLLPTFLALRSKCRRIKPDIVYVASPLNLLEIIFSGINAKRILVTEHSSYASYNFIYRKIISFFYPKVGLLLVPTKTDSEIYSRRGINNIYLPNPLPFYPEQISPLSTNLALCVGRLTADKRHDLLIDIWKLSGIYRQGWKLKIIGKGETELLLRRKIDQLVLNDSVFICEPTSDIEEQYLNSSIFLLTSRAEGFGMVLVEAMACGVPCISFDCPSGPRDIVDNGISGMLLEEHDVDGYALALRQLASDKTLRKNFGLAARHSARKFSSESVKNKFLNAVNHAF